MGAVGTAHAQESVREDAALEKGLELVCLLLEPHRMWRAFIRGTQSKNLYSRATCSKIDASKWQSVAQLGRSVLTTRVPHLLFRFSDGHQPHSLVGTFRKLMRDSGLLVDAAGQTRTLNSLRHTYATLALLEGGLSYTH